MYIHHEFMQNNIQQTISFSLWRYRINGDICDFKWKIWSIFM